jgi:hypothetical protein
LRLGLSPLPLEFWREFLQPRAELTRGSRALLEEIVRLALSVDQPVLIQVVVDRVEHGPSAGYLMGCKAVRRRQFEGFNEFSLDLGGTGLDHSRRVNAVCDRARVGWV